MGFAYQYVSTCYCKQMKIILYNLLEKLIIKCCFILLCLSQVQTCIPGSQRLRQKDSEWGTAWAREWDSNFKKCSGEFLKNLSVCVCAHMCVGKSSCVYMLLVLLGYENWMSEHLLSSWIGNSTELAALFSVRFHSFFFSLGLEGCRYYSSNSSFSSCNFYTVYDMPGFFH